MKQIIIGVSLITAIAFLGMSVFTTYNIFTLILEPESLVRNELWILLVVTFTGGVILLSMAWGIAELTESRRANRELQLSGVRMDEGDAEDF
ncbi:MAG: hypothetical protein AAFR81_07755 [Chloroflexota bacterium]